MNTARQRNYQAAGSSIQSGNRQRANVSKRVRHRITVNVLVYISITCFVLAGIGYVFVGKKAVITSNTIQINALEKSVRTLKKSNDEKEAELKSQVNLQKIREIATDRFGMTELHQNQVVRYRTEDSGYFKQYKSLTD